MIGEDSEKKQEDKVEWKSDYEIEFKIIIKELNVERKRFLVLNIRDRKLVLLTSTARKRDLTFKFIDIAKIERSMQDHRQVMIKVHEVPIIYLFTFSSVYKVLQFLELYSFVTQLSMAQ